MSPKDDPALFHDEGLPEAPGPLEMEAYAAWNEIAERVGWTKATKLTPDRCRKIKRAVKEAGGLAGWRETLERGAKSPFLTTKFKPDLEFFTRLPKLLKTMEGGFDGNQSMADAQKTLSKQMDPEDQWARWLRDYRLKGFWPSSLGPRPEEAGCKAPPAMLEACRARLGIVVAERAAETLEDRLTASRDSYTRLGQYARANAVEQKLADIQNRPPVLIPAPSASDPDTAPEPTPKPYRPAPRPSEAEIPRQMAAQDAEWFEEPEGDAAHAE